MASFDPTDPNVRRASARVGQTLRGKYVLIELLGFGGMASVYEGKHRNGNRVAVKILHSELSSDGDVRRRFLQEGYAANRVDHAGVVRALDDDVTEDGTVFLVLELLRGSCLADLPLDSDAFRPRHVFDLLCQLLEVLEAAHEKGVIHRDLKPENLFLTEDGTLKVLDFGLARLQAGMAPHATQSGQVFGTPAFMPPEQALGRISSVDAQSDLWAAAASAFYLLTKRTVHVAETAGEYVVASATLPAPALRTLLPEVPEALAQVVDRGLAFDKQERWSSAKEMLAALRHAYQAAWGEPPPAWQRVALDEVPRGPRSIDGTSTDGATGRTQDLRKARLAVVGAVIGLAVLAVTSTIILLATRHPAGAGVEGVEPSARGEPAAVLEPRVVGVAPILEAPTSPSADAAAEAPVKKTPRPSGGRPNTNPFDHQ